MEYEERTLRFSQEGHPCFSFGFSTPTHVSILEVHFDPGGLIARLGGF